MHQGSQTASVPEVRDEIQAIRHSRLFAQSPRRIRLLEYLCDMVLLGRQDEIKETTIALEVFERTTEFDDKKDAIVRVEAHRLRERLAKYYATEGSQDPLIIELSPGGYIPRFVARDPEAAKPATEVAADPPPRSRRFESHWKVLALAASLVVFALGAALAPYRRSAVSGAPSPLPVSLAAPGRRRPAILERDRAGSRFGRAHPSNPDSRRRLFRYRSCRQRLESGQLLHRRTAGNS